MKRFLKIFLSSLMATSFVAFATETSNWTLSNARVTYLATHKFHDTLGVSTQVKGLAKCTAPVHCDFLIAVPLKSFDSENSNRDQHMLKVTNGALNPAVAVRVALAQSAVNEKTLTTATISFAGVEVKDIPVEVVAKKVSDTEYKTQSDFDISLKTFNVEAPALLGMSVNDKVKIHFEGDWQQAK